MRLVEQAEALRLLEMACESAEVSGLYASPSFDRWYYSAKRLLRQTADDHELTGRKVTIARNTGV